MRHRRYRLYIMLTAILSCVAFGGCGKSEAQKQAISEEEFKTYIEEVEITPDNWEQYFSVEEYSVVNKDAFGDETGESYDSYFLNYNKNVCPSAFDHCTELFNEDGFLIFGDYLCSYRNENEIHKGVSLKVPEGIKVIGVEAFPSTVSHIELPEGVESICAYAFPADLETVTIPASVKEIDKNAFYKFGKCTIEAPEGSYACEFATENGISYKAI